MDLKSGKVSDQLKTINNRFTDVEKGNFQKITDLGEQLGQLEKRIQKDFDEKLREVELNIGEMFVQPKEHQGARKS